jgi:hypothetical protein
MNCVCPPTAQASLLAGEGLAVGAEELACTPGDGLGFAVGADEHALSRISMHVMKAMNERRVAFGGSRMLSTMGGHLWHAHLCLQVFRLPCVAPCIGSVASGTCCSSGHTSCATRLRNLHWILYMNRWDLPSLLRITSRSSDLLHVMYHIDIATHAIGCIQHPTLGAMVKERDM